MCPLQIIDDIEPLSLTLHGIITFFIHQPPPPRKSDNFDFDVIFFKEHSIAKLFEICSPAPGGGSAPGGCAVGGLLLGVYPSMHCGRHPPVNRMTDRQV